MPKQKSATFKRPKRIGMRKSKNARYDAPLKGQTSTITNFGDFTGRQLTFLAIAVLSFYLFIVFAVMRTFGPAAGIPLLGGLLVFVVAIVLVWWLHNRHFHGDEDSDQLLEDDKDDDDLIYPGSQTVKPTRQSKQLAAIDRSRVSAFQEDELLLVKPAPLIQALEQDLAAEPLSAQASTVAQASTQKVKRTKQDLEAARRHYQSGAAFLKQEQLEEAKAAFQKAIELNPDLAKAHEGLGRVYLKQAQYQAATIAFQTAIAANSDIAAAHEGLGRSLLHQEQLEDAKTAFQQAIHLDAQFFRAYEGLGRACFKVGQIEEAIGLLRKALEINPKYQPAVSLLKRVEEQGKIG